MSAALDLTEIDAGALVVAGAPVTAVSLFAKGGVETVLSKLETEVRGIKRDISTLKGRAAIKSLAFKVARSKTALDEMGKGLNETKRAEINKVDAERRIIRERCDALKEEVLSELTAWETKEADRVAGHEAALAAMSDLVTSLPDEPSSQAVLESLDRLDLHEDGRDWQEFAQRAHDLHAEVGFKLTGMLAQAVALEEAAAEAERVRLAAEEAARVEAARVQAEREARIAVAAAEAARIAAEERAAAAAREEAERVAEAQQQAEARAAAKEKVDAAARIIAKAKADADAAEAARRERQKIADEEAARQREAADRATNLEIKAKVNREILADLITAGAGEDLAKAIIGSMVRGHIRHVKVTY
jgi:colicin import membrane protein